MIFHHTKIAFQLAPKCKLEKVGYNFPFSRDKEQRRSKRKVVKPDIDQNGSDNFHSIKFKA